MSLISSLVAAAAALLVVFLLASSTAALAQVPAPNASPPSPMIIEPADADAFRELVELLPQQYARPFARWYMMILQRQQAKAAEEAKTKK